MTRREVKVVDRLGDAFNEFCKLKAVHPTEREEFCHAIHAAQTIVMARGAQRFLNRRNKKVRASQQQRPTEVKEGA